MAKSSASATSLSPNDKTASKLSSKAGLLGTGLFSGNNATKNATSATFSTAPLPAVQSLPLLPHESALERAKSDALKYLENFQANKAKLLDAVFTKASLYARVDEEEENDEDRYIDSLVPFPEELPPLYAVLVHRLEHDANFDRLIPFVLRRLFEFGNEYLFIEYIWQRIQARDTQVEQVCYENAVVLVEATAEYVDVNHRIDKFRDDVVTLDDREVYDNQLKNIRSAKKATQTTSIILQNVATLIERISAVRPTLQHYDDALPAAARGEMVKALRHLTLAEEKSQHLPANISFVKWLAEAITDTKQRLIVASLQGVTKTLETLRTQNSQVGYVTLRNICRTRGIFVAPYHVREGAKATVPIDVIAAGKTTIQQNMNIRPLLRYRHVVQTLINETRGLDSARVASTRGHLLEKLSSTSALRLFLQNSVGTFASELYISHMIPGISSELYYNELWRSASHVTTESLVASLGLVVDEPTYRETRDLLHLFIEAVQALRCDATQIIATTEKFGYRFMSFLLISLRGKLQKSIAEDQFDPVVMSTQDERPALEGTLGFWFDELPLNFPKQLPFSPCVTQIVDALKEYITKLIGLWRDMFYAIDVSAHQTVILTKHLIENDLRAMFSQRYSASKLTDRQFVQLHHNFTYLEEACITLEKHMAVCLRGAISSYELCLNCEHAFDVMRGEVESELFSKFTFFIEQTVKTIRLDIAPVAAKQTLGSAESKKIVDAMESFMPMIATLPLDVGQRALALANSTVVASVERHLGSQEVKVVSTEGLLQLRVDLALIEQCLQKFTVFSTDTANDALRH
ncbi:hypothetical protein RvY_00283 [Ramazzottius varieornatus]|uniref:Uncharacterized protein n=1 Tax=Ramazzottius varieornatus TaxID=947166 RepID=A0A1D1UJM6_RAMVA|nr:hypothetical protein RvY_00283 [Ramazzottius varieornatus]